MDIEINLIENEKAKWYSNSFWENDDVTNEILNLGNPNEENIENMQITMKTRQRKNNDDTLYDYKEAKEGFVLLYQSF